MHFLDDHACAASPAAAEPWSSISVRAQADQRVCRARPGRCRVIPHGCDRAGKSAGPAASTDRQRRQAGHVETDGGAADDVSDVVDGLHQTRHGDDKHEADRQPGNARLVRGGASVARSTSTTVKAAAVATATWPDGNSSDSPPSGRWRWTTCLSNDSIARAPGTVTKASTSASHRLTRQAMTGGRQHRQHHQRPDRVRDRCRDTARRHGSLAASCQSIISASAGSGQRVCQRIAAAIAATNEAATLATGAHGGLSGGCIVRREPATLSGRHRPTVARRAGRGRAKPRPS